MIPGKNKSNNLIKITGIDKIHLKCDCINRTVVNGIRQPILYRFSLDKPTGHWISDEPRVKLFKKINKSVLSHITIYLKDNKYKPVDFIGEKISFTCQLVEIWSFERTWT